MSNFFHFHLYFAFIMLQYSATILLLAACTVKLLHRYSVTKCVLPEICSLFMPYMKLGSIIVACSSKLRVMKKYKLKCNDTLSYKLKCTSQRIQENVIKYKKIKT